MRMRVIVPTLLVFLSTLVGLGHAENPAFTGTCDISQISYIATGAATRTVVSNTFTDLPGTVLFFNVTNGGCLKIELSTSLVSQEQGPLLLRVVFDQNPKVIIVPGEIRVHASSKHSYLGVTFILPLQDGLEAGNHNVRVQWRSPQARAVVSSKTVVVIHHN
jgi:hypothetical protein